MAFVTPLSLGSARWPLNISSKRKGHLCEVNNCASQRVRGSFLIIANTSSPPSGSSDDNNNGDSDTAISKQTLFPVLYDAWFGPDYQLKEQMQSAIARAYDAGVRVMELQWPVVPNLEEIAAGTMLNFRFGKQTAAHLGMSELADYALVKRYLASFCNLWWAIQVAEAKPFCNRKVWILSIDGVSKARASLPPNVQVISSRRDADPASGDVIIVVDPRYDDSWRLGMDIRPSDGIVVFLNSQFNESYGLTGPRRGKLAEKRPVYFLKRVTRGYAFFSFPGPWRACLEKPDLSIEELATFDEEPKLRTIANVVREESNRRYGGFNNDRYVRGFGGRL